MHLRTGLFAAENAEPNYRYQDIIDYKNADGVVQFTKGKLIEDEKEDDDIQGIIALDIDNTILNFEESEKSDSLVFIFMEELLKYINLAKKNRYKIIICTARVYDPEQEAKNDFCSAIHILNHFPPDIFSCIYFTYGNLKTDALKSEQKYYPHLAYKDICLMDDMPHQYDACFNAGFSVVCVENVNSDFHLSCLYEMINAELSEEDEPMQDQPIPPVARPT